MHVIAQPTGIQTADKLTKLKKPPSKVKSYIVYKTSIIWNLSFEPILTDSYFNRFIQAFKRYF